MFSATMPPGIAQLAQTFMKDPVQVRIAVSKPAEGVKQGAYVIFEEQKQPLILHMLRDPERKEQSIIVFCSRKQFVGALYQQLKRAGINVGRISSDLEQEEREEVMQQFRNRNIKVLVATDVISRGIDIDGIDMVVNFDVPRDAEDYVHRVGRTARAQRRGEAVTLISPSDQGAFRKIEQLIEMEVEKLKVPEMLGPVPSYQPSAGGGSRNGGKSRNSGKRRFSKGKRPGGGAPPKRSAGS
jgi:superfamily II DNA/RNA helicase